MAIQGLTQVVVQDARELLNVIQEGASMRATTTTRMNQVGSLYDVFSCSRYQLIAGLL